MSKIHEVIKAIKEADMTAYMARNPAVPFPLVRLAQEALADSYTAMARAAIEAMREPQVEMIAAFWRQKNTGTQEIGGSGDNRSDYDAWRAAIDAALNEQVSG